MNFLTKRKLGKNANLIVRLAIAHFDRPTDLKNAFLSSDLSHKELKFNVLQSIKILKNHSPVLNDIRLAYLRAICSITPSNYAEIISLFPELLDDSLFNARPGSSYVPNWQLENQSKQGYTSELKLSPLHLSVTMDNILLI